MILVNIATFIAATVAPTPSVALQTGQCLRADQVRAALAVEGMNPIIVGNRTGYGFPTSLIFFSNGDGSRGVLVRGDKPLGQQATTACIDSVYRDIRLHDISKPGIPAWAKMGDDQAVAETACKRDHLGYQEKCSAHDRSLAILDSNGQRVLFMATGTAINPRDKSVRRDQRILLTFDGAGSEGLLSASTAQGASYILSAYTKGAVTQYAEALTDR